MYADIAAYNEMYARYLKNPYELLDWAGDVKGKAVWDLCCGGGDLTRMAVERGASFVIAVDSCRWMLKTLREDKEAGGLRNVSIEKMKIESFLPWAMATKTPPDVVMCRQAVNYWMTEHNVLSLAGCMKPGSVFVFNTFCECPTRKPMVKEYELDGKNFVEVSWLVGKQVLHVQIREGMPAHTTEFMWISPDDYFRMLSPYFDLLVKTRGKTALYHCTRR